MSMALLIKVKVAVDDKVKKVKAEAGEGFLMALNNASHVSSWQANSLRGRFKWKGDGPSFRAHGEQADVKPLTTEVIPMTRVEGLDEVKLALKLVGFQVGGS